MKHAHDNQLLGRSTTPKAQLSKDGASLLTACRRQRMGLPVGSVNGYSVGLVLARNDRRKTAGDGEIKKGFQEGNTTNKCTTREGVGTAI